MTSRISNNNGGSRSITTSIMSSMTSIKQTNQNDSCALLKVELSFNYKYNNAALIQLILQTVSGVQNHVWLADVDHARYCVPVTI